MKHYLLALCFSLLAFAPLATKAQDYKKEVIGKWYSDHIDAGESTHLVTANEWAITYKQVGEEMTVVYNYEFTSDKDVHLTRTDSDAEGHMKIVYLEDDKLRLYIEEMEDTLEFERVKE